MRPDRLIQNLVLVLLAISLSSCGWQLRGSSPANLQFNELSGVYVSGARNNPVAEALRSQLRFHDIALLEQPAANSLAVILEDATSQLRVMTVGGDLRAEQMRLQVDASFSLYNFQAELLTSENLQAVRYFNQNPLEPAASARQQELLTEEIADQLAEQILRLLPSYAASAREDQG